MERVIQSLNAPEPPPTNNPIDADQPPAGVQPVIVPEQPPVPQVIQPDLRQAYPVPAAFAPAPVPAQTPAPSSALPPLDNTEQFTNGALVSSHDIDTRHGNSSKRVGLIKKLLVLAVVILLVGGAGLFIKSTVSGLSIETLSNGGYTYSFKFFKPASLVQLSDSSHAIKHGNSVVGAVSPSNAPSLTACSQIGPKWREVFRVNMYGQDLPVCTFDQASYVLRFSALNHRHLFTITYKDASATHGHATLKTIFESVAVAGPSS